MARRSVDKDVGRVSEREAGPPRAEPSEDGGPPHDVEEQREAEALGSPPRKSGVPVAGATTTQNQSVGRTAKAIPFHTADRTPGPL